MKTARLSARSSFGTWGICLVLLSATLLNYMDRQVLAVTLPTLKEQFQLAEGRVGLIEGSFGFSFAAGSLLFGVLADRWGPRFLYPTLVALWSIAGLATGLAGQEWVPALLEGPSDAPGTGVFRWLLGCRVALGLCEAGHWPCAMLTVRSILDPKDRTLGNGILQSGASIGAVIVPIYIEASDRLGNGWEFPFWSIGLAGLVWIPVWLVMTAGQQLRPHLLEDDGASVPGESRAIFVRRLVVLAVIVAALTISWQFLRAWLALYLQDYRGYSKLATRGLISGYFIAADVGCLAAGFLVSALVRRHWRVHSARQLGFAIFTLLTACGAMVPFATSDAARILFLFLAGAGILGLHPYYYSLTQELHAPRIGVLSGALAAFGWIVASVSQILLGQQIEATKSYQLGLMIVGLVPVLGLIALVIGWPRSEPDRS